MRHPAKSLLTLSLTLCAMFCLLCGCENSERQSDAAVAKKVEEVEKLRLKATDAQALDGIQSQYDTLAATQGLSPEMKAIIRGRQAQLRMERTMMLLSQLRGQELGVMRLINDLQQLGVQVAGSQMRIDALNKFDPTAQIQSLTAQQAQIKGSADQTTWKVAGGTGVDIPTLSSLDSQITQINADIEKNKSDSANLSKTSHDNMDQADQLSRQSESESGDRQLQDTVKATELRRDAEIADAHRDTLAANMVHLQESLSVAQAQKAALDQAAAALDTQVTALNNGWTQIQQQIQAQQALERGLIGSDDNAQPSDPTAAVNITAKLKELASRLQDAESLRESVNTQLSAAIQQYGDASAQAAKLRQDLMTRSQAIPNDPDALVWDQLKLTLHPATFNLQMADAMEAKASVAAAKTGIDIMLSQMLAGAQNSPGLVELLKPARSGIDVSKALADIPTISAEQLDQDKAAVNTDFQDTLTAYDKTFGGTDSRDDAQARNNLKFIGRSVANREWAQFSATIGDTQAQDQHTRDAQLDDSQVTPSQASSADATAATARQLRPPGAATPSSDQQN
jgi:hypothetical protein